MLFHESYLFPATLKLLILFQQLNFRSDEYLTLELHVNPLFSNITVLVSSATRLEPGPI